MDQFTKMNGTFQSKHAREGRIYWKKSLLLQTTLKITKLSRRTIITYFKLSSHEKL